MVLNGRIKTFKLLGKKEGHHCLLTIFAVCFCRFNSLVYERSRFSLSCSFLQGTLFLLRIQMKCFCWFLRGQISCPLSSVQYRIIVCPYLTQLTPEYCMAVVLQQPHLWAALNCSYGQSGAISMRIIAFGFPLQKPAAATELYLKHSLWWLVFARMCNLRIHTST